MMRAMSRTLVDRIEARLKALGKTPEGASREAGLSRDFVRTLQRRPTTSPRAENLAKLAHALECNVDYLLAETEEIGKPDPLAVPAHVTLPVLFEVAAGPWLAVDELPQEPLGYAEAQAAPEYPFPQWLERVKGDSFNQKIPDGALIHVVDALAMGYAPRHGDVVVVTRTRAQGGFVERTVKEVEISPDGQAELWPRSYNPKWTQPVDLASGATEDTVVQIVGKVIRAYLSF